MPWIGLVPIQGKGFRHNNLNVTGPRVPGKYQNEPSDSLHHNSSRAHYRLQTGRGVPLTGKAGQYTDPDSSDPAKSQGSLSHPIQAISQDGVIYANSTRLHTRNLQWFLLPYQQANASNSRNKVRVPLTVRRSLCWWTSSALDKGSIFREPKRSR